MNDARLPDAPWLHDDALKVVVAALEAPRIVGGAVRDALLGQRVSDIDLATPLRPDEVTRRLEHAGLKAIPTGIDHGTITAVSKGRTFEITTLRRDVSTDGRRATVAFSDNWREDAARRDFTINALYADPKSGEIFDYFGGLADLEQRNVRFIGDADARIAEDHLRILRFFRFHARFGQSSPDATALAACAQAASSLKSLSRERIADELLKLLSLPNPQGSCELMQSHGIFAAFMPEVSDSAMSRLKQLLVRETAAGLAPSATRRLLALLPANPATVDQVAARLKLSNRMRAGLAGRLACSSPPRSDARALGYRHGVPEAIDQFLLFGTDDDWQQAVAALSGWEPPIFPIKGGELVARGLSAGPQVAQTLQAVERAWVAEGFPDAFRAAAIADQMVAEKLSDKNE
jgi:poly(A) polymerase